MDNVCTIGYKKSTSNPKKEKKKIYYITDLLTNKKKCRFTTFKSHIKKQNKDFKTKIYKTLLNKAQASCAKENTAVSC